MKKLLLLITFTFISTLSFGQYTWWLDFDNPAYLDRIVRDTITNPNCIWQIGQPGKTVFTSAHSVPNAIVTDTLNPVPPNDTSVFYLIHLRDQQMLFHIFALHFWYQMDGDTTDKGMIEISPDGGSTWINLLSQDSIFQFYWNSPKPTLTGTVNGWQSFDLNMQEWASGWGSFPIYITADTVLFRFTYITDSSSTPHDGWIIDDFFIEDWEEGISEIQNNNLISVFPNPTSNELNIKRVKHGDNPKVQILNYTGQVFYNNINFDGDAIDTKELSNGIYLVKYSDNKYSSIKTFVVQR